MGLLDLAGQPGISLRLSQGWRIGASSGGRLVATGADGSRIDLTEFNPLYEAANRRLTAGATLAELRDSITESGGTRIAIAWLVLLQDWCRRGLIEFPLVDGSVEQAVIVPQWSWYVPALAVATPPADLELHRFAYLRNDCGAWLLESPLCAAQLRLKSLEALGNTLVRRALSAGGFFESEGSESDMARRSALRQWEFHDLLFHMRHRGGWRRDALGAAFPFEGDIDPLPAERPAWNGEVIDLPGATDLSADESLARVSERRRSVRSYDETSPISLCHLGALLYRCARVRPNCADADPNEAGAGSMEFASRPYPSAGACYELEVYPIVDRCRGLNSGAYHYDAPRHRLVRIAERTAEVEEMISQAKAGAGGHAEPQILLVISARFPRVMWKYRSISYGLILRNTGVLYQALYLAATELGLAPCALGSGDSALFARLTGLDPVVEGSVGEFMLGSHPSS